MRRVRRQRLLALLLLSASTAYATPPPPPEPKQLREASMKVSVHLLETRNGRVSKRTRLCEVSGKVPVYADDGSAAGVYGRQIAGCRMRWQGGYLPVEVRGAVAVAPGPMTFATAVVSAVPPDARPLCPDLCGPQPLADSSGEVRASGIPATLAFGLTPNPGSILNAKPPVWLEADVVVTN